MRIIEIKALDNGSHWNQEGNSIKIPKGWAVIPEDMETPNFPFGKVTTKEIDGVMTVTKWVAGEIPEPEPEPIPEIEPTAEDMLNALVGGMSYE